MIKIEQVPPGTTWYQLVPAGTVWFVAAVWHQASSPNTARVPTGARGSTWYQLVPTWYQLVPAWWFIFKNPSKPLKPVDLRKHVTSTFFEVTGFIGFTRLPCGFMPGFIWLRWFYTPAMWLADPTPSAYVKKHTKIPSCKTWKI